MRAREQTAKKKNGAGISIGLDWIVGNSINVWYIHKGMILSTNIEWIKNRHRKNGGKKWDITN